MIDEGTADFLSEMFELNMFFSPIWSLFKIAQPRKFNPRQRRRRYDFPRRTTLATLQTFSFFSTRKEKFAERAVRTRFLLLIRLFQIKEPTLSPISNPIALPTAPNEVSDNPIAPSRWRRPAYENRSEAENLSFSQNFPHLLRRPFSFPTAFVFFTFWK